MPVFFSHNLFHFTLAAIANGDLARLMGGAGGGMSNPYSMQQGASSLFGNPMLGLTGAAMAAGGSATGYGLNRALQVSIRVKVDQLRPPVTVIH